MMHGRSSLTSREPSAPSSSVRASSAWKRRRRCASAASTVTVVGPEAIPLARILGDEVGRFVRSVHEENGVAFELGLTPARITASEVVLSDGSSLPADVVVIGVGVRPRTKLAEEAGLRVDNGIVVDEGFRTSTPDVFAVGDVARYPYDGEPVRIEHFAVAVRHGQAVARIIAGRSQPYRDVPFFWSQHHDVTLSYVGHAQSFDAPEVRGDLKKRDAIVAYRRGGRVRAVLTVGTRPREPRGRARAASGGCEGPRGAAASLILWLAVMDSPQPLVS